MAKPSLPWGLKLSFILAGAFLALLLVELGLRLTGFLLLLRSAPDPGARPGAGIILCVGDSYTYNANVKESQRCTSQLQQLLDRDPREAQLAVVNKGVCEYNSRQLARSLPGWLARYKPKIVVLLVGSANLFNPRGRSFYQPGVWSGIQDGISDLRLYKLGRIAVLNLKARSAGLIGWFARDTLMDNAQHNFVNPSRHNQGMMYLKAIEYRSTPPQDKVQAAIWLWSREADRIKPVQWCREVLRAQPGNLQAWCALGYIYYSMGDSAQAERCYAEALALGPRSEFVLGQLAFYYERIGDDLYRARRYDQAARYLVQGIELDPQEHFFYYQLGKIFALQSGYSADEVVAAFEAMKRANPGLARNRVFNSYYTLFRDREQLEARIAQWLQQDLETIAAQCRRRGATLVVQNYPIAYPMANKALETLARRHNLALVDNYALFSSLIARHRRERYIEDSDHCTPLGYRVMARNIHETLARLRLGP